MSGVDVGSAITTLLGDEVRDLESEVAAGD